MKELGTEVLAAGCGRGPQIVIFTECAKVVNLPHTCFRARPSWYRYPSGGFALVIFTLGLISNRHLVTNLGASPAESTGDN